MAGKLAVEIDGILDLLRTGRTSHADAVLTDLRDELAQSFWAAHPERGAA